MTPVSRICLASARPSVLALISVILEIEVKFADVIHMDNIHILQFLCISGSVMYLSDEHLDQIDKWEKSSVSIPVN